MTPIKDLERERLETKRRIFELTQQRLFRSERALYEGSFKSFVQGVWTEVLWPGKPLKWNWHLDVMCEMMEAVAKGEINRLIINVPPRSSKTTIISICYQVWRWLHDPSRQFLCLAHSGKKARADATKARNVLNSRWFRDRWGHKFHLAADANAKDRFETNHGGHRLSFGMTTMLAGENADEIIIDDPHDPDSAKSEADRGTVLDNYDDSISQRLNDPGAGAIIVIMQRLHPLDLTGHIITNAEKGEWVHILFPQEFEPDHPMMNDHTRRLDPRSKFGELLWEDRFPAYYVRRRKKTMTALGYSGQHQQRPNPAGGSVIRKEHWRPWPKDIPIPDFEHTLHSWDTAFTEDDIKKNARSAMTGWAIFWNERRGRYGIMLTRAFAKHLEYPALRKAAKTITLKDKPDTAIIEKKASGISLIQDMRKAGIPVASYTPDKSKLARAYAVSAMFESGMVYYPEGKRWAQEVIDECASFPNGVYSDLVDTVTQALIRIRNMQYFNHPDDMDDEDIEEEIENRAVRDDPGEDVDDDQPAYG